MIRLEDISKSYAKKPVLDRISLEVRPGTVTVVAGADGAGKSTLLKASVGLVRIDSGRILFRGRPVGIKFEELRRATGFMPEKFSLYADLTVGETLSFIAEVYDVSRTDREAKVRRLLAETGLTSFIDRRAADLSGGMRKKLALCATLLPQPEILILDEPTAGIDPLSRREVIRIISGSKAAGKAVLMSTSHLQEAETADEVIYLKNGRAVLQGGKRRLQQTFPGRVLRLYPEGNVLDVLPMIFKDPHLRRTVIVRGNSLTCQEKDGAKFARIPLLRKEEIDPSLEDICLFAERDEEGLGIA